MSDKAVLNLAEKSVELPVVVGTENEHAIDIGDLRAKTGYITLDDSYANTGSCLSAITYIDGDKGILRYRGYPIEELAEKSMFPETAYLLIVGELPNQQQLDDFRNMLGDHQFIHEDMRNLLDGLEEAGMNFSNVAASNVYLDNLDEFAQMNGVYAEYFPSAPPARTTVQQLAPGKRQADAKGKWPTLEQISMIAVK